MASSSSADDAGEPLRPRERSFARACARSTTGLSEYWPSLLKRSLCSERFSVCHHDRVVEWKQLYISIKSESGFFFTLSQLRTERNNFPRKPATRSIYEVKISHVAKYLR